MTTTLNVAFPIEAVVYEIKGGGFWAEVSRFPGCVAQAETIESLHDNLIQTIEDWLGEWPLKTEEEARRLAAIQETDRLADDFYPRPYEYQPPPGWSDDDE